MVEQGLLGQVSGEQFEQVPLAPHVAVEVDASRRDVSIQGSAVFATRPDGQHQGR